jgi:hypothetical protein
MTRTRQETVSWWMVGLCMAAAVAIAMLAGCALTPSDPANSHELIVRYPVDGVTSPTLEVLAGVPKAIGETGSRVTVTLPTGAVVDAATSTTKNTLGGFGMGALGVLGGYVTGMMLPGN